MRSAIAAGLEEARARTIGLLEPLPDADLLIQHSPLMSPLVWDLAHVGNYEEVYERNLGTGSPLGIPRGLNQLWNAGGIQYAPPIR